MEKEWDFEVAAPNFIKNAPPLPWMLLFEVIGYILLDIYFAFQNFQ